MRLCQESWGGGGRRRRQRGGGGGAGDGCERFKSRQGQDRTPVHQLTSELRRCVKVEVTVLDSHAPNRPDGFSVNVKQH